jgi:hypothetical protein
VNLTDWTSAQGIHAMPANRWYRESALPVLAGKADQLILVSPGMAAATSSPVGSEVNGAKAKECWLLTGPAADMVTVEHRSELGVRCALSGINSRAVLETAGTARKDAG